MPDADEELASGLKEAKKKRRNFAIISSGSSVLKVIVSKKAISAGVLSAAKKEVGGKTVTQGVVGPGEGGSELMFMVDTAPSLNPNKLKVFIDESVGMKVQPTFKVVAQGADLAVDESDDDEAPGPSAAAAAAPASAATPGPASPAAAGQADAASAAWKQAVAAMTPAIQAAIKAKGPNVAAVAKLLSEALALSKQGDQAKALETLKQCHALATQPAEGVDPSQVFNKRLAALMPAIKAAIATPLGGDLKTKVAQAGALAQKKDFAPANLALDGIEQLLKQEGATEDAAQAPSADQPSDAGELRDRIKDVQIQAASLPDPVKAQLQERAKQALAQLAGGSLETLAVEVDGLENDLAEAARSARADEARKQSGDAVSYRLLQGQWRDAQARARGQLQQFVAAFLADPEVKADPAFEEVKVEMGSAADLLPTFGNAIEAALEAIDLARDDEGRTAARSQARQVLDGYTSTLQSSDGLRELQSLSDDEYGGISFYSELQQAVTSLKNQLGAR